MSIHTSETSKKWLQQEVDFYFMNPIDKWRTKRRFPYKLLVQLAKIILVTLQLCLFAFGRYNYVNYIWDNKITFKHLFLNGWSSAMAVNTYPPPAEPLAIYKIDEFYETIDYAFDGYYNLKNALGGYDYVKNANMELCIEYIHSSGKCITINSDDGYYFSSAEYLEDAKIDFESLKKATLTFPIKGKMTTHNIYPRCYEFYIKINFYNFDHDGQIILDLDASADLVRCNIAASLNPKTELRTVLNYLIIILCSISFVLCSRAVVRGLYLRKRLTKAFYEISDSGRFVNYWYITICLNDIMIIIGCFIKQQIESTDSSTTADWNLCSVFLGCGNLLVWMGVLRYLGFFKTYNLLIMTVKRALPQIFRFLLCAAIVYIGFTFCGWVILGPYHIKFRSLTTTAECLFSLVNGDDMFATFSIMSKKSTFLWWFSKCYLYSFICLYIYIILNLFITVINGAYETVKGKPLIQ